MTLEELRGYRGRDDLIKAIYAEISSIYSKIPSPSGGSGGSSAPGDPTAAKVARIATLEDKIDQLQARQAACERFLDEMQDDELCAIMRYKFICGYSWNKTAMTVGHRLTAETCRKMVKRYFETEN